MNLYRHGDLCLKEIVKLPKGLKASKSKVLLTGNQNHDHSFDKGIFYDKVEGDFNIGYLKAEKTTLSHFDHGDQDGGIRKAKIKDGIYELRRQVEHTNDGMKQVID